MKCFSGTYTYLLHFTCDSDKFLAVLEAIMTRIFYMCTVNVYMNVLTYSKSILMRVTVKRYILFFMFTNANEY